jgi:hypothetical protein
VQAQLTALRVAVNLQKRPVNGSRTPNFTSPQDCSKLLDDDDLMGLSLRRAVRRFWHVLAGFFKRTPAKVPTPFAAQGRSLLGATLPGSAVKESWSNGPVQRQMSGRASVESLRAPKFHRCQSWRSNDYLQQY